MMGFFMDMSWIVIINDYIMMISLVYMNELSKISKLVTGFV